ncbi:hypothetical protein RHECNPAF_1340043 [Rhizobium etli CNPAF512]|nr:hypothetical protein RHECNPAF_1340043 [Rhizobium etli CNPAF512]
MGTLVAEERLTSRCRLSNRKNKARRRAPPAVPRRRRRGARSFRLPRGDLGLTAPPIWRGYISPLWK